MGQDEEIGLRLKMATESLMRAAGLIGSRRRKSYQAIIAALADLTPAFDRYPSPTNDAMISELISMAREARDESRVE